MSGHNKWSQIKRQKGAADVKKGASFTKLSNNITLASKEGGGDPAANFKLRLAIDKARDANMPKDNIERSIKRGTGELGGAQVQEATYEAYGPAGTAYLIETISDNKNRTVSDVKSTVSKAGGRVGEVGSVAWMFETKGVIQSAPSDNLEELIIDSGANDYEEVEDKVYIYTDLVDLESVKKYLTENGAKIESAEISKEPKNPVVINDKAQVEQLMKFVDRLEELDDVTQVYPNFAINEELL
ncbi:MAG: YebC/PmpR family DNA-binding transcriptional regulator [Patescibacteria group bacterium]